eukprot:COSAG06_NODE_1252_length_10105_cov_94.930342_8_plen_70_part_00
MFQRHKDSKVFNLKNLRGSTAAAVRFSASTTGLRRRRRHNNLLTQPSGPVSFINAQTLLAEDSGDEDPP